MKSKTLIMLVIVAMVGLAGVWQQTASQAASNLVQWKSYTDGLGAGKKEGKKIFLHFYATWCGYCRMMDKETFGNPKVAEYLNENFIPIKVNSDSQRKIALDYQVRGLPSNWFLTESGEKIGNKPGFISADDMMNYLKFIKTDSYKKMTLATFLKKEKD